MSTRRIWRKNPLFSSRRLTFLLFAAGALLSLYLVKSALGIDLLHNYSLGLWGWLSRLLEPSP